MSDLVYNALHGWASIPTWRTSHPADVRRFREAIATLDETADGAEITQEQVRDALRRYRDEVTEIWGGKASDQEVDDYARRVLAALNQRRVR